MADITTCSGEDCDLKELCYRYTAILNEYRQSCFIFSPEKVNGVCEEYLPNDKADKLKPRSKKLQFAPVRVLK